MATVEWTVLEKLLLSQAVYKYGEDNWFQIARNLKHHALLDRPSDYFNQKNCSLQYYLMVEDMDKQKRQSLTQDMPTVVRLARDLYSLRLEELKKAISEDEEKFLILVSEIDDIRAGKWDNQLLGLPETTPTPTKENDSNLLDTPTIDDTSLSNTPAESSELNTSMNPSPMTTDDENKTPVVTNDAAVVAEEEKKVEADNLENKARDVKEQDTVVVEQAGSVQPATEENTPIENVEQEKKSSAEEPAIPAISITTSPRQPQQEQANEDAMDEQSQSHKRHADDTEVLEESELKRQKTEDISAPIPEPMTSQSTTSDLSENIQEKEEEEDEPLVIDTTRTDYSTDVSQGTTPADTSDIILRDGTESVAGSESNAATPTADRRRGANSMKDDQRHKSWQKNINLLWREIANHKNGAMFMNPIKEIIAPHYYDIVKRPMDLKTIKNRIRDGLINTTTEFERDVVLMLNNSLMYNKEGTEIYQMAREMLDDAAEQIKIFKTADTDTSASSHTRAASMAAKERRKSVAIE